MIREWLLIVWLGTSTNFTLQGVFWSQEECHRARLELAQDLGPEFTMVCVQDLREGRSSYPSRSGSQGLVK